MASIHAPKRRCQALLRPMAGALSRGGISADRAFAAAVALLVAAAASAVAGHVRVTHLGARLAAAPSTGMARSRGAGRGCQGFDRDVMRRNARCVRCCGGDCICRPPVAKVADACALLRVLPDCSYRFGQFPAGWKLPTVQRLNATMDHLQVITQFSFKAPHGIAMVRGCMPARGDGVPLSVRKSFATGFDGCAELFFVPVVH
ncbi:hypothetical protein [Xanthomonas arboricola]|uniref:hypothetical protein n=1 Tax=Xanthomonas arboricola TaxID=56448 RepID=UPI0011AFF832